MQIRGNLNVSPPEIFDGNGHLVRICWIDGLWTQLKKLKPGTTIQQLQQLLVHPSGLTAATFGTGMQTFATAAVDAFTDTSHLIILSGNLQNRLVDGFMGHISVQPTMSQEMFFFSGGLH